MADVDRFRLRRFIEELAAHDELDTVEAPTRLTDVAERIEGNPRAVLFQSVGLDGKELVANVMGSRRRLALALGVPDDRVVDEVMRRSRDLIKPIDIDGHQSPAQEVVLRGDDVDLTQFPVHLQHHRDGGPYISAALDVCTDPVTGRTNVGVRRLMLRGPRETGVDLNAPSDLRVIYQDAIARGERLPIAFVVGSHPADYVAATTLASPHDELELLGGFRQEPVPVVRCVSCDLRVPADAEIVLEGYLDETGFSNPEGPYGEFHGYYGAAKMNPVFHVTAITHRRDALFQTATISGPHLAATDTAQLVALRTEASVWMALQGAVREPIAVRASASSGGMFNVRISMRPRFPGEARNAMAAAFASTADVKHVYVMNDDIDIDSDEQVDWAIGTRFQADRDLMVVGGFRAIPLDPSLGPTRMGAKAGFDLTAPLDQPTFSVPTPPRVVLREDRPSQDVAAALAAGPCTFADLMMACGSDDGREIVRDLHTLDREGILERLPDGRYAVRSHVDELSRAAQTA